MICVALKNGNKIPFFSIQNNVKEENLNNHFDLIGIKNLNKIKMLRYSDNAKMYQIFDFIEPAAKVKISLPIKLIEAALTFKFEIASQFHLLR